MDLYETFNKRLNDFIVDLQRVFPNIKEFREFKSGVSLAKNINKKTPSRMFHKYVSRAYSKQILDCNEQFFLTDKSLHDINMLDNSTNFEDILNLLRNLWTGLDDSHKKMIWLHLKVLIVLDKQIEK